VPCASREPRGRAQLAALRHSHGLIRVPLRCSGRQRGPEPGSVAGLAAGQPGFILLSVPSVSSVALLRGSDGHASLCPSYPDKPG